MIKAQQKPINEIIAMLKGKRRVLVAGCGTCVTVCFAGGEREANLLASQLKLASAKGRKIKVDTAVVQRQCEKEFNQELASKIKESDAVLSIACGVGVQVLANQYPKTPVLPGLNTTFMGPPQEQGVWFENCAGCGDCLLHLTGGICPIARCAKTLLNGPCGGSQGGKCEVSPDTDCGWNLIYDRLKSLGRLKDLDKIQVAKDWQMARDGGPRRIVREDLVLSRESGVESRE